MTGIGTILSDDPRLDVRAPGLGDRQPLRVVVDRALRMPAQARVLNRPGRTIVATVAADATLRRPLETAGAELVTFDESAGFLQRLLAYLAEREQINEVLVEAGPGLAGAMLAASLVDELVLYQAPVLLGNLSRPLFNLAGLKTMSDKMTLHSEGARRVGRDLRLTFTMVKSERQ